MNGALRITVNACSPKRVAPAFLNSMCDDVYELLGKEAFPKCESPSLRLEKFVCVPGKSEKVKDVKRKEIEEIVNCQKKFGREPEGFPLPKGSVRFPAMLKSRLIVNQAGGILENAGLCLHPHFGYPYIPGSAVKGVARHAAWCEWNEEKDETKKVELAKMIARVFGYPTNDDGLDKFLEGLGDKERRSGCVSFWAATPEAKARLVTDIVNCHHKDYYAGSKPEASDDEKPIPVFFPAVEKGATFLFTLVPMRGATEDDLVRAKAWLTKAITESGVGAKTSAGYGWFDYSEEAEQERAKVAEAKRAEEARKTLAQNLHNRIFALAAMGEKSEAFKKEIASIEIAMKDVKLPQSDIDEFNKQKGRLPVESRCVQMFREWAGLDAKTCLLSHNSYLKQFGKLPDSEKKEIVLALRQHDVWKFLRDSANVSKLPTKHQSWVKPLVEAIRAFAKTTPEGKMP